MKLPALLALGTALALTAAAAADPPHAKDGYVKARVEVETRGVLKVTDKSAVLLTRFRYFDLRDDKRKSPLPKGFRRTLSTPTSPGRRNSVNWRRRSTVRRLS